MPVRTETVGQPDGPAVFVPAYGREVGTFLRKREDLIRGRDVSNGLWLMHHVPPEFRGTYRISKVDDSVDPGSLRTDDDHFVLCGATTKWGDRPCESRALNRTGFCSRHGGQLHPLDKIVMDSDKSSPGAIARQIPVEEMTRWQQLLSGVISVDDLDDEELARGQCRDKFGRFGGQPPKSVPKEMHDRMVKELFMRADNRLKESLLDVVDTMVEIAKGSAYEPADRIKASTWVFERLRGKVPDTVVHTQDKPWEHVFTAISGGSRSESRRARGLDTEEQDILDAEYLDEEMRNAPSNSVEGTQTFDQSLLKIVPETPIPLLEDQLDLPHQEAIYDTAPQDGYARDKWEREKAEERALAEDPAAARKALRERLKKAQGQRYAARERGENTIDVVPLEVSSTPEGLGGWRVKFSDPKAPAGYGKSKGNPDFRHKI